MPTPLAGALRRYAMSAPVELQHEIQGTMAGLLIELTQESARISQLQPGTYAAGDSITVQTPCGRKLPALVHSTFGSRANVRFAEALHLPELAQLLDANRSQAALA